MQGHIGMISRILYEDCASYVDFGNEHFGIYNNDALLMLTPPEVALDKLRNDIREMDMQASEVLDIFNIYMLNETGAPEIALESAFNNPRIAQAIIFSVQDWVEFQIERFDQEQK